MIAAALPTAADVGAAAGRLRGAAVRTPLLEAPDLSRFLGGRILIPVDALQQMMERQGQRETPTERE